MCSLGVSPEGTALAVPVDTVQLVALVRAGRHWCCCRAELWLWRMRRCSLLWGKLWPWVMGRLGVLG